MKCVILISLSLSLVCLSSCDDQSQDQQNEAVESYIDLLKKGEYADPELPAFTSKDIPALLEYISESQSISDFPQNMISSVALSECALGIYVLWTIESIRAVAIDSEFLIGKFPSLTPSVIRKEEPFEIEEGVDIQGIVANAYLDWWGNSKTKDFDAFKDIDPMDNTEYRWN